GQISGTFADIWAILSQDQAAHAHLLPAAGTHFPCKLPDYERIRPLLPLRNALAMFRANVATPDAVTQRWLRPIGFLYGPHTYAAHPRTASGVSVQHEH